LPGGRRECNDLRRGVQKTTLRTPCLDFGLGHLRGLLRGTGDRLLELRTGERREEHDEGGNIHQNARHF